MQRQRLLTLGCRQVGARFIPLVRRRKRADPRHARGLNGYGTIGIILTAPRGVAYATVRFFPPLASELYGQGNRPGRRPRSEKVYHSRLVYIRTSAAYGVATAY
jgi:hypothetical protein